MKESDFESMNTDQARRGLDGFNRTIAGIALVAFGAGSLFALKETAEYFNQDDTNPPVTVIDGQAVL